MNKLLHLLLCILFVFNAYAQQNLSDETKSFVTFQKGTYLLQNLILIDGTGGAAKTNQDILIVNDVIDKVGVDLPTPQGATVINMEGKSAMPGMVMLHEHLFYPKPIP